MRSDESLQSEGKSKSGGAETSRGEESGIGQECTYQWLLARVKMVQNGPVGEVILQLEYWIWEVGVSWTE